MSTLPLGGAGVKDDREDDDEMEEDEEAEGWCGEERGSECT